MDPYRAFMSLGIALGVGLIVGLQRQRADSALAGVRTFPLITMFGTVCAMLGDIAGGWILAAGLVCIAAATAMGNVLRPRADTSPGITTEVAALVMFGVGALLWVADWPIGVAVGASCALLLHLKHRMHALADKLSESDMIAIMQFCAITFIILPVLPDRTYGPMEILNPRQIWWMVVLVVGISLLGYVALKFFAGRAGIIIGGLIGGLVSSTATTASYSRRAGESPAAVPGALLAIVLASCVVHIRVLIEIGVAARADWGKLAPPVLVMLGASALVAAIIWFFARRKASAIPEPKNPAELKPALYFGAMYAVVLFAVAAAERFFGHQGLFIVSAISGLTDMDAITLSTSRMVASGTVPADAGWRAIVIATISNLVFKTGIAGVLGSRRLLWLAALSMGASAVVGVLLLIFWPDGVAIALPQWISPAQPVAPVN